MNQIEQVIALMRKLGGYATFRQLNTLLDFSTWKTQTPQASVRRIVQESRAFFKIRPGLWALEAEKISVLKKLQLDITSQNIEDQQNRELLFTHTYIQGVLVEIGNIRKMGTCVPAHDRNLRFLETPLSNLTTVKTIYKFTTYQQIFNCAKTVDVIWFNNRNMPQAFFEIEHTTNIKNSLEKFFELQDYFARFCIVASEYRKQQFDNIFERSMFAPLKDRVDFIDYETLINQYNKMSELEKVPKIV
jgi:hypothetical protein